MKGTPSPSATGGVSEDCSGTRACGSGCFLHAKIEVEEDRYKYSCVNKNVIGRKELLLW